MRRKGYSLKLVVVASATFAMLLVLVSNLVVALQRETRHDLDVASRSLHRIANVAAPLILNNLVVGDLETVQQILEGLNADGTMKSVALFDPLGEKPLIVIPAKEERSATPHWFSEFFEASIAPARYPVQAGGRAYALLELQASTREIEEDAWAKFLFRTRVVAVALSVVGIVVWLILTLTLRHLDRFAEIAKRYGQGERNLRAPDSPAREIAPVIGAFNRMADDVQELLDTLASRELQLREAKEALEDALAVSKASIWTSDLVTNVVTLSEGWGILLDLPAGPTKTTSRELLERVHPDDRALVADTAVQFMRGERDEYLIEHRVRSDSGIWKWIQSRGHITERDPVTQRPTKAHGINLDITDRKSQEMELAAARNSADMANRAKSKFLATMSHEIRTPMIGILGVAELLLAEDLSPAHRELAETLQNSGRSLLSILDNVLDYSKIESARMTLERRPASLSAIVDDVRRLFGGVADKKSLRLHTVLGPELPSSVFCDPTRLRQVLQNLVANAVKFTQQGSITIRVSRGAGDLVRFEVEDTGIGIEPAARDTIFDAFRQADEGTTRRYGGTGLGLTISKELVTLMGGRIGVDETPGGGSRFWFAIPLAETIIARSVIAETEVNQPFLGLNILVADDHPINASVIRAMLVKRGASVAIAQDGERAVAMLAQERFDAVLMDCEMPELDGAQAARIVRAREKERGESPVPIIAVTAHTHNEMRDQCLAAGMNDYLIKPFESQALEAMISRYIRR